MASVLSIQSNSSATLAEEQKTQQLPVSWYVDPAIYEIEQAHIFATSPQYIGHTLMVPNEGDFYTVDWMHQAKALVHDREGIALISNVCRHRQALMLKNSGNTQHIVCPLHRWTYSLQGELLGAPHFEKNPCLHLNNARLQQWNGLLFENPPTQKGGQKSRYDISKQLGGLGCKQDFDFTGYRLGTIKTEEYAFNWKTFIEVYLEDYHVEPFHPGLAKFVDCDDLNWEFGDSYSSQTVGIKQELRKSGSAVYEHWQQQLLQYSQPQTPRYGAIWMAYYPFLMVEWYPYVLVVSHLVPRGVDACTNVVEFYYPEDIALFEQEFMAAQQAAYAETAAEDKEICERMHQGRQALFRQGIDERGPYQRPMETGLEHFHTWLRTQLEPHLAKQAY